MKNISTSVGMFVGLIMVAFFAHAASDTNFESGGLGRSQNTFINQYGPEDKTCALSKQTGGMFSCLKAGDIALPLMDHENISHMQLIWGSDFDMEMSRAAANQYIPEDSELTKSYLTDSGSTVDVYLSKSLQNRFDDGDWDEKKGEFIVIHSSGKRKTVIGINNNP